MKIARQHILVLKSDNFHIEIQADFVNDTFGISVGDSYSKKTYLHLADDTAKELIEILKIAISELENHMNKEPWNDPISMEIKSVPKSKLKDTRNTGRLDK